MTDSARAAASASASGVDEVDGIEAELGLGLGGNTVVMRVVEQ